MKQLVGENAGTHDELFVANGYGECAIEGDAEVVRIVTVFSDDMLQQSCFQAQNLS